MKVKLAPLLAYVGRPGGQPFDVSYHLFLPEQARWLAPSRKVRRNGRRPFGAQPLRCAAGVRPRAPRMQPTRRYDMASDPAPDQQAQLDAAVSAAESAVSALQSRVTTDLDALRSELEQIHQQQQQSGAAVDLTTVIERVTTLTTTISEIDVTSAVQSGDAPDPAPVNVTDAPPVSGTDPAPADPGQATSGDQGEQVPPPADPAVDTGVEAGTEQPPPGA